MSARPYCGDSPGPQRKRTGPLAFLLSLAVSASGCSTEPPPNRPTSGVTSKVPEIAKRQKHMADMLKKAETKAKSEVGPH